MRCSLRKQRSTYVEPYWSSVSHAWQALHSPGSSCPLPKVDTISIYWPSQSGETGRNDTVIFASVDLEHLSGFATVLAGLRTLLSINPRGHSG
jgi:hypothetical protein